MCRSMVNIQSPTAEIRRGQKKKKERNIHRASIICARNRLKVDIALFTAHPFSSSARSNVLSKRHFVLYDVERRAGLA